MSLSVMQKPNNTSDHSVHKVREMVEHAGHVLPTQAPLDFFIHHNTLHAFEALPFVEALQEASNDLGSQSLMEQSAYLAAFREGRIKQRDLDAILGISSETVAAHVGWKDLLSQPGWFKKLVLLHNVQSVPESSAFWCLFEQNELRTFPKGCDALVCHRHVSKFQKQWVQLLEQGSHETLRSFLTGTSVEQEALHRLKEYFRLHSFSRSVLQQEAHRDESRFALTSLWLHCLSWAEEHLAQHQQSTSTFRRHRDRLLAEVYEDLEERVRPVLIRFFSHFLDQGVSYWPLPERNHGILHAFLAIYDHVFSIQPPWLRAAVHTLHLHVQQNQPTEMLIEKTFALLQVEPEHQQTYLTATLLSLRGWMGMVQVLSQRPDLVHIHDISLSLLEATALHLVLEASYLKHEASLYLLDRPWSELRTNDFETTKRSNISEAYRLFSLCVFAGVTTEELWLSSPKQRETIASQLEQFDDFARCWQWHLAYERSYHETILNSLQSNAKANATAEPVQSKPSFQVVCCIDEREESFRRHMEEIEPSCETFGVAGFFGLDMYYQGALDAHARPLCPANIRPKHIVYERAKPSEFSIQTSELQPWQKARSRRRLLGWLQRHGFVGSRSLFRGMVWSLFGGILNLIPMLLAVLFPRLALRLEQKFKRYLTPPSTTYTTFQQGSDSSQEKHGDDVLWVGYTQDELVARAQTILRFLGMTKTFSPLVFFVGHGSTSLNNPHEAAHDCGACGGGRGGANARIFAAILNLPEIREALRQTSGIDIPTDTHFVGGFHDTASDAMVFYDLDTIPPTHTDFFLKAQTVLEEARQRNAHERCRRFEFASLSSTPSQALHHVETRSHHLAEVRPEYGHATNAICVVGRRELTRGLFLDRRAFLVSYDPSQDPNATVLSGLLGSVGPVCAGINLEYFFSFVDNVYYGCGTKLPHNITGFLGVMNGFMSDLRTGLPWQMVEIHEPMRLLMIVESPVERIQQVLSMQPVFAQLVQQGWILLAAMEPESFEIHLYQNHEFLLWDTSSVSLPEVVSSIQWYQNQRDHLAPARIQSHPSTSASFTSPTITNSCRL